MTRPDRWKQILHFLDWRIMQVSTYIHISLHVCVSILQNMTISRLCSDKKVITLTDNLLARVDDYYYHHQWCFINKDRDLSLAAHVTAVCRSGYNQLRQLRPVVRSLSVNATKTLVQAFISCRLDCCNSLLFGISDGLLHRLQSVENAAACLVTGARRCDHITPVLRQLHWLPVRQAKLCLRSRGSSGHFLKKILLGGKIPQIEFVPPA